VPEIFPVERLGIAENFASFLESNIVFLVVLQGLLSVPRRKY
jgi:hypothetical protein